MSMGREHTDRVAHLVAAHVGVTHEVEGEVVGAGGGGRGDVQLGAALLLQRLPLDGQQCVAAGVAHHQPPVLVLAPREPAARSAQHSASQPYRRILRGCKAPQAPGYAGLAR